MENPEWSHRGGEVERPVTQTQENPEREQPLSDRAESYIDTRREHVRRIYERFNLPQLEEGVRENLRAAGLYEESDRDTLAYLRTYIERMAVERAIAHKLDDIAQSLPSGEEKELAEELSNTRLLNMLHDEDELLDRARRNDWSTGIPRVASTIHTLEILRRFIANPTEVA